MLGELLKPAWQSDSADRRLGAIKKLKPTNPKDIVILDALALNDPDHAVRTAAVDAIAIPEHIFALYSQTNQANLKHNIELEFIRLIGSQSKLTKPEYKALIKAQPDSEPYVLQHCPIAELREQLLEQLDENVLAELIGTIEYAQTRIQAAQRLESEKSLEIARKHLKGKDKSALKIIKSKLNIIRSERRAQTNSDQQAKEICDKLNYIANHNEWRKEFAAQFKLMRERWTELSPSPDYSFEQQFLDFDQTISKRLQKIDQEHALRAQARTCLSDLQSTLEHARKASVANIMQSQDSVSQQVADLKQRWRTLNTQLEPSSEDTDTFKRLNLALQRRLELGDYLNGGSFDANYDGEKDKHEKTQQAERQAQLHAEQKILKAALTLINKHPKLEKFDSEVELEQRLDRSQQQAERVQKAYSQDLKKLHQRISRLIASGQKGNLHIAKKELNATVKLAEVYTGNDKKSLDERLEIAREATEKLSDWHRFATEPKFIELCESMEALSPSKATTKLHPDKLAQKIHKLQNDWKKLGSVDNESLWIRFKTAADEAFIPCAEFFNQRDQIRSENLKKREPLISELNNLVEKTIWNEDTDYRSVESKLRQLHQRWQNIKNVAREDAQEQWNRYRLAREQIFDKLAVEYDRNSAAQQNLISQTLKLVSSGINETSFEKLKQLQSSWKQIGITRQKDDRKAWKTFKASTDAAYAAIKEHQQASNKRYDEMLDQHQQVIKEIRHLTKQDISADSKIEALQTQYYALPSLPKDFPENKLISIEKSFKNALSSYQKSRERLQTEASRQQRKLLKHKSVLCFDLERAYSASTLDQDTVNDLLDQLAGDALQDKSLNKRIVERIQAASSKDRSAFDEQRHKLCIELEILSNIESPAQDRQLRTNIQLSAMSRKGLGAMSHSQSIEQKTHQLKIDWLCLPGANPELQHQLDQRLEKLFR